MGRNISQPTLRIELASYQTGLNAMKNFDALIQAANLTAIIATIYAINPLLALALAIAIFYSLTNHNEDSDKN